MAYAVSIFFDEQTDTLVRHTWAHMAEAGISALLSYGPYRPHLTLAIYDELNVNAFVHALTSLVMPQKAFPVVLPYLGVFTGGEVAVFLAATVSQTLLTLHQRVHALLPLYGTGPHPYYLPDSWNPHCSIARRIDEKAIPQAVALCLGLSLPLQGHIASVGIIETPAEKELHVLPLGADTADAADLTQS